MSDISAEHYLPETGGTDVDAGQNVIDSLRWKFASSSKMERGDFYMARSLELLERISPIIDPSDKERLRAAYIRLVQTTQA